MVESKTGKVLAHLRRWFTGSYPIQAKQIDNIAEMLGCNGWSHGVVSNLERAGHIVRVGRGLFVLRR